MSCFAKSRASVTVHELVVISGKGGTGKTSIVASLAVLADGAVLADCDVEAADLDLILTATVRRHERFFSGHIAVIRGDGCLGCGDCMEHCRFAAVHESDAAHGTAAYWIDPLACEGCGTCVRFCPAEAIDFVDRYSGEWFVSDTRHGPLVHARLRTAEGNSGKLVATVREEAKRLAAEQGRHLVIIDGPPGIGCPVIASLTGTSLALVVTEPTPSGEHDLDRILNLTRHFDIPAAVCVNKWDVNPSMAERIERRAREQGASVVGRVRYDIRVTAAQLQARAPVETPGDVADDIRTLWQGLTHVASAHGIRLTPIAEPPRSSGTAQPIKGAV
jgi:MinD superfamily P-loop ATPase